MSNHSLSLLVVHKTARVVVIMEVELDTLILNLMFVGLIPLMQALLYGVDHYMEVYV